MTRTKQRSLVTGQIATNSAAVYAVLLGGLGFYVLSRFTNPTTVVIGIIGFIDYTLLYAVSKRRWAAGTVIGSISGATPIAAGYTAVTGHFDIGALLLFLIMVIWQMPHFYGISLRRLKEYKAAKVPVLPLERGPDYTKRLTLLYIAGLVPCFGLLFMLDYVGLSFVIVMIALSLRWLWLGLGNYRTLSDEFWGKKMFLFSLVVLLVFSVMLAVNAWVP